MKVFKNMTSRAKIEKGLELGISHFDLMEGCH
jgi:hypothetical protein